MKYTMWFEIKKKKKKKEKENEPVKIYTKKISNKLIVQVKRTYFSDVSIIRG